MTSFSALYRTEEDKPQAVNVENPEVTFIPDPITENHANDSDSDGPILYKDDEEDDEEDEYTSSMCTCLCLLPLLFSVCQEIHLKREFVSCLFLVYLTYSMF